MSKPSNPSVPSPSALATLLLSSGGLVALAVYQWFELLEVRAGGVPSCAINDTFNCASVWNSPFAHAVHEYLGIPVAGLGVLWGLVAFSLSLMLLKRGGSIFAAAVKGWALAGLLSCVAFGVASMQAHAVCLTCLGTYVLVMGFAMGAFVLLGKPVLPPMSALIPGTGWALVLSVAAYFALLYPGSKTPKGSEPSLPTLNEGERNDFDAMLAAVPEQQKLAASWARAQWKAAPVRDVSAFPVHARKGSADAPLKVVEFTDILCSHCAQLEEVLHELEQLAPEANYSIEARYFPLVMGECASPLKGSPTDHIRCLGARMQICAEKSPSFSKMRRELFQNQTHLDETLMFTIASRHGLETETLKTCIQSPETATRLAEDIAYAKKFGIEGTPLLLLNGKVAPFSPVFLVGMAMSQGDADAPYFLKLPPPPVP